jgi:hypothetical protein
MDTEAEPGPEPVPEMNINPSNMGDMAKFMCMWMMAKQM